MLIQALESSPSPGVSKASTRVAGLRCELEGAEASEEQVFIFLKG